MPSSPPQSPPTIRFSEALIFWLKLGFISFGGPAGQIALMHETVVEKRRWLSEQRFLHALNYCMLLPGPEAQQLATYIGWLMHRTWGGIVAGGLFVLPSLLILIGLAWLYLAFGQSTFVSGLFYGIKPAVTAIVLHAAHRIGKRTLRNPLLWGIAITAFIGISFGQLPFPAILLLAAIVGILAGRRWPEKFCASAHAPSPRPDDAPRYLLDEDAPSPPHTRFRWSRLGLVLGIGSLLWALPMAALALSLGWMHTLTQMAWFFTKAALLTFGGAYAVLPYVYHGAVGNYGWLSAGQMIDGLALGETTPGPLIMVVAFVGFLGGYQQALFGSDQLFLAGATAACLVTWFTFLPSFIFIFAGGPLVESTRHALHLNAPLTAMSAAIVGVIFNLALFFASHTLWPQGMEKMPDWTATAIALGAAFALFRYQAGVIRLILGCALIGLVRTWIIN